LAKVTDEEVYRKATEAFMHFLTEVAPKTPKGMIFYAEMWGSLRYASKAALLALQVSKTSKSILQFPKILIIHKFQLKAEVIIRNLTFI
jgi:hypothetical protein